ncbi:MazG nucleotide pyrophosphohydrolase domain-containing protein [Actinomadura adrarensis]|uniref:MazG nucleotide pyrophosphohydrolase domain-containing protein n=1 Tax=Actinomadura adrarensis TaxID=1819600 RepID=A0ABW3CSK9_9ACTN
MSGFTALVSRFHAAFGLPRQQRPSTHVDEDVKKLRRALLEEETRELDEAMDADDLVAIADALGDIVYVALGTAVTYGIDLDAVLAEVHRSNMSKLGPEGRPLLDKAGKVIKSDQYFRPNIADVLARQKPLP